MCEQLPREHSPVAHGGGCRSGVGAGPVKSRILSRQKPSTLCLLAPRCELARERRARAQSATFGAGRLFAPLGAPLPPFDLRGVPLLFATGGGRVQTVRFLDNLMKVAADGLTGGWSVLCWFASGGKTSPTAHTTQGGQQHEHNG